MRIIDDAATSVACHTSSKMSSAATVTSTVASELGGDTEQGEQVEVARRVVQDVPQPVRAPPALALEVVGRDAGDLGQRGLGAGEDPRHQDQGAGHDQQQGRHAVPPSRDAAQSCSSRVCSPNISRSSSGSAWS